VTALARESIEPLVPHGGRMCLLERVDQHDERSIRCAAISHRDPQNPLCRDGRLAAVHLSEYAAQAVAVHGALAGGGQARPGMLAALRDIRLHVAFLQDLAADLLIEATRRIAQPDGSLYEFRVTAGGRLLAQGRLAISFSF
jgi:predicted hotdog family 3-hydroxylacyl-ACP dehydratase